VTTEFAANIFFIRKPKWKPMQTEKMSYTITIQHLIIRSSSQTEQNQPQ